jgi:hypothetical protein
MSLCGGHRIRGGGHGSSRSPFDLADVGAIRSVTNNGTVSRYCTSGPGGSSRMRSAFTQGASSEVEFACLTGGLGTQAHGCHSLDRAAGRQSRRSGERQRQPGVERCSATRNAGWRPNCPLSEPWPRTASTRVVRLTPRVSSRPRAKLGREPRATRHALRGDKLRRGRTGRCRRVPRHLVAGTASRAWPEGRRLRL